MREPGITEKRSIRKTTHPSMQSIRSMNESDFKSRKFEIGGLKKQTFANNASQTMAPKNPSSHKITFLLFV